VLFLGLGTGLTAGAALVHPEVERIDVVELIPEVVEAARYFEPENLGVCDHPRVTIRIDDARHDLLGASKGYDVIVSDLFVPWESRSGYLYTVEHFRLARDRLQPGEDGSHLLPVLLMPARAVGHRHCGLQHQFRPEGARIDEFRRH
jgi:spermidine synthase